jgi:hypothetical protein
MNQPACIVFEALRTILSTDFVQKACGIGGLKSCLRLEPGLRHFPALPKNHFKTMTWSTVAELANNLINSLCAEPWAAGPALLVGM